MEEHKSMVRITLAIVMVTSFITPFMSNAINIAIPSIGIEFSGNQFWLNWIVSGYLIASAAFLLPFGRLADMIGRKKIFLVGIIALAAASLACALATSLPALVWFRVAQGTASAMIFGTSMAILTSVVPPQSRGKALGLSSAATYIGLSTGPVLGGLICSAFNWRGIFYFNFILAVAILILTLWKLKGDWTGAVEKFDTWGSIFCVAGQALLLYGLADLTAGYTYVFSAIAGIVLILVFIRYELRLAHPLMPMNILLKNRPFAFSNLAAMINYCATFALAYVMSLYLQAVLGLDTATSGLVLLSQPIVMAVLSPLTGALSDRIQPSLLASLGMGITSVGLFFFIFLGPATPLVLIVLNLMFIGLGFAFFSSPNTNAVMSSVERTFYGIASSTLGNMRMLGQSLSMAIVSLITSFFVRNLTVNSAGYAGKFLVSLKISFTVFTVLCILGVFASLARGKIGERA